MLPTGEVRRVARAEEAVRLRRRLAARNPDAFKEGLASSLTAQARVLLKTAHGADALQPADDAVAIYRAACRADSDPLRPERARALILLAQARHARGLATDALAAAEEGVAVLAGLTTLEPEAHAPELARALGTRALVIANTDPELAWASVREAIAHLARHALVSPGAFADQMRELGTQYLDLCRTLGREPEPELLARLGDTRP